MAGISLTRSGLDTEDKEGQHVWPLKVIATSSETGLGSKIFVYHAAMSDDAYEGDIFECVASMQQMKDIPEDSPALEDDTYVVPYYRTNSFVVDCRSPEEAEELWEAVKEDVGDLITNFRSLATLDNLETINIDP